MKLIKINTASSITPKSSVLLIYTGGTLGMIYDKKGKHLIPFDFEQIFSKVPELDQFESEISVLSFPQLIDSSNVNPTIWIKIAETIEENYEKYDGFVVLHGTDTMAYSASALSFLLEGLAKPVIFTGAQLPIGAIRNDARRNLVTSIQVAGAKEGERAIVSEVCIFFNDLLLRGNRAKKIESVYFDAFHSENYPALAKVGVNIMYNFSALLAYNPEKKFKVYRAMSDEVAILKLFPGINQKVVCSILQSENLSGLILETYGSGNAPTDAWFIRELKEAIERGMFILNVSQCVGGKVIHGKYETSKQLAEIGLISGDDISTEAALSKMMFLLAQKLPAEELQKQLSVSIRGEMSV